jgi:HPt (histidine-containing phosphotransfer) domain-containing protein
MNETPKPERRFAEDDSAEPLTLDCDHILTCAGGDSDQIAQLCAIFLSDLPVHLESLRAAIKASDNHAAGSAVRNLRNCLTVFGAGPLTVTLDGLDAMLRSGSRSHLRRDFAQLQSQIVVLVPQVQRLFLEVARPSGYLQ